MILTGRAIEEARRSGTITIDPFDSANVNPNSYNFHLGPWIVVEAADEHQPTRTGLPVSGFVLLPNHLYLAATSEVIGSTSFVTTLLGRSSLGRLGLFLNTTADLGHAGAISQWTLELSVVQPLRVYPGMCVGQVAFWVQSGPSRAYDGRYQSDLGPVPNRDDALTRRHSSPRSGSDGSDRP